MGPLSVRALQGLKSYKYSAGGYTWLDDAHQPMWTWFVDRMPMTLAPNVVTLAGTLGIVVAYLLNIIYNPGFTGEAPTWVTLVTAASVVLYVNLDCMDGKQARRTGSSSPLGQLFDHGCDAFVLHMMLANIAASLGVACGWKMAAGCLGVMVPWMLAHWEEYHRGIMMYGNACYGVLEANYSICAVHLITACLGLSFWSQQLALPRPLTVLLGALCSGQLSAVAPQVMGLVTGAGGGIGGGSIGAGLPVEDNGSVLHAYEVRAPAAHHTSEAMTSPPIVGLSVAEAALLLVSFAGVTQGVSNVVRVFFHPLPLDLKEAGHKQVGRRWALIHLLGLLTTCFIGAWSVATTGNASCGTGATSGNAPTSSLSASVAAGMDATVPAWLDSMMHGQDGRMPAWVQTAHAWVWNDLLPAMQCRAAFSMWGFLYAHTATQLIVAHMSKEPWMPSITALALPAMHIGSQFLGWPAQLSHQLLLLLGLHALAVVTHVRYTVTVISQICSHLGIKCLSIPPPPAKN